MKHECSAEDCPKKASHMVYWQLADLKLLLCIDHFNMFINAPMTVTQELESDWREPDPLQAGFNSLVASAREALARGDELGAGVLVGKCQGIVVMAKERGTELDTSEIRPVEEALFKFPGREKKEEGDGEEG